MANNPGSLRTALSRVRFLGSAKSGTHHAWHMRVTSVALVPLSILFMWIVASLVGKDYKLEPEPLRLVPQDKLIEIVRQTQNKALKDEGGEAENE